MAVLLLTGCEITPTSAPEMGPADAGQASIAPHAAADARAPSIEIHPDVAGLAGVDRSDQILYSVWSRALSVLSDRHGLPVPETRPVVVGNADYRIPVLRVSYPDLVLFGFDEAEPLGDMDQVMRVVVEILRRDEHARAALVGHTDSVGSDSYNLDLSARRARSVLERLIAAGVDPARVETIAAGEAMPRASNATEAGRAKNRRVEVLLSSLREANRAALRKIDVSTRWLNDHPAASRQGDDFPAATVETTRFPVFRGDVGERGEVEIRERSAIAMNEDAARVVRENLEMARPARPLPDMRPKARPLTVPADWDPTIYGGGI